MKSSAKSERKDIVVIGAGVIGLACAFRLIEAGFDVTLIDAGEPGAGCSAGNAGHVATELVLPLASISTLLGAPGMLAQRDPALSVRAAYALKIAPWLARFAWAARPAAFARGAKALASLQKTALEDLAALLTDAEARYLLHTRGNLLIAEKAKSVSKLKEQRSALAKFDVPSVWLSPSETLERAPDLKIDPAGAIYFSGTGHVADPRQVSKALAEGIVRKGGRILRSVVRRIESRGDGGFSIAADEPVFCSRVLVAAGVGSAALLRGLGHKIPLDTERGYALTYAGVSPGFDMPIASFERSIIMTPMSCGLRVTGGVELGGVKAPPTQARFRSLERHARDLLGAGAHEKVEHWMGRRPTVPDYLPVLGESERHRGLFFAFGHQHLGLTLSAVTARVMTALISGGPSQMVDAELTPFRAGRF